MSDVIRRTIDYLNQVTDSDFTYDFPSTVEVLTPLINAGYGFKDFKKVIDLKWQKWKGTKYESFVRPTTLFGKNFENYLNEHPTRTSIQKLADAVIGAKQANWKLDKR